MIYRLGFIVPPAIITALALSYAQAAQVSQPAPTGPDSSAAMPRPQNYTSSEGVAAKVNDIVISDYDVTQRVGLFIVTSGINPTSETLEAVRSQVLRTMVDEVLEREEAKKYKIEVTQEEVTNALTTVAEQNNLTIPQMQNLLTSAGLDPKTLQNQITTQLSWDKLVEARYFNRLNVADSDVDSAMKNLKETADKPQYEVSEIFLGVDVPEQDTEIKKNAQDIMQQIELGVPFGVAARQLSQSPSGAQGGNIGWIVDGQLSSELNDALKNSRVGQLAGPIRSAGGYYILYLNDRRDPVGTKVPEVAPVSTDGSIPLKRLLLPLPPDATPDLRKRAMQIGMTLRTRIKSCTDIEPLSKQLEGSVYMDLGARKPAELSAELKDALAKTEAGDVAEPFLSQAGLELIVRCDPRVVKVTPFKMPTRDEVTNRLYGEQVAAMSRSYLRELRRDAVVETR